MTYEMYRGISAGAGILGGILLAVSVGLFWGFHIPRILGELTGLTARRALRRMKRESGQRAAREGKRERRRGKPAGGGTHGGWVRTDRRRTRPDKK